MKSLNSIISTVKKLKWKSIWAGSWTLMPCSDWGEFFTRDFKPAGRLFLSKVIFIFRDGKVSCWMPRKEIDHVARRLAKHFSSTKKIKILTEALRNHTDIALEFIKRNQASKVTSPLFERYLHVIRDYYQYHRQTRDIAEGLSPFQMQKFLPLLQRARVYAEPVFERSLAFDRKIASAIARQSGLKARQVLFMTRDEIRKYFKTKKIPRAQDLSARNALSVLLVVKGKPYLFVGKKAARIESLLAVSQKKDELQGITAYPGKVEGVAKIVLDPKKAGNFKEGDILVTGMTRPEFLLLMKKSAAIVTDAGGLLCHAAITAREMKKPCVIGTQVATKILRDGDLVEVDANKGIIKKL